MFDNVAAGREPQAVDRLNDMLGRYRVRPSNSGTSADDWHMHVAAPGTPYSAEYLAAAV
ncbi:hypothetical protein [Micromonospora sp. NPDC047074]|uniref:hypothetical protein n=1 Tax=Micromonospora sp. NPDC047074 TaxID=3154339 RepID=UPI0034046686